jgi:hypothetical protein
MPGTPQTLPVPPPVSVPTLLNAIRLAASSGGSGGSFAELTGSPYDNAALSNALASAGGITPRVIYVTTDGNDTTGDGSFSKPYLTAQKAYDTGVTSAVNFCIKLGVGSFSISTNGNVPSIYFKFVEGCGFETLSPLSPEASLTILTFSATPPTVFNASGTNGPACPPLGANNIFLYYFAEGGSVETNDEVGNYTGGSGGSVSVFGNATFVLRARGGNANLNSEGQAGFGGSPGSIALRDGYLFEAYCSNGVGYNAGTEIPSSIPGPLSLDGTNASLVTIPSVIPTLTSARSSLKTGFTITTDLGGNAIYP